MSDILTSSSEDIDISSGPNVSERVSEKAKEQSTKSTEKVARIQKDEKKAVGDNDILFVVMQKFLQSNPPLSLQNAIVDMLALRTPSYYILWIMSVFFLPAHTAFATKYNQKIWDESIFKSQISPDAPPKVFHPDILDIHLRDHINIWIASFSISMDLTYTSTFMHRRLADILSSPANFDILATTLGIGFAHFLSMHGYTISQGEQISYARHILGGIYTEIKNIKIDKEDISENTDNIMNLFGLSEK
jgi:hypothetical protein